MLKAFESTRGVRYEFLGDGRVRGGGGAADRLRWAGGGADTRGREAGGDDRRGDDLLGHGEDLLNIIASCCMFGSYASAV